MAMRTPQPSANLFITIMVNCERSFFQDRSDLRSDHLPLTALLHKCVGPDEFSPEKILFSPLRFDRAFADHDSSVAIKTHVHIVNLKFGEKNIACHAFQIGLTVHDAPIRPDNRPILGLKSPSVATILFDAQCTSFV